LYGEGTAFKGRDVDEADRVKRGAGATGAADERIRSLNTGKSPENRIFMTALFKKD